MRIRGRTAAAVCILVCGLVSAACGADPSPLTAIGDDAITVASFNFPESEVIAEIYAGALEDAGFDVVRERAVGARELVIPALQRGLIEVVPEYAGSALTFLGGTASTDPAVTHALLASMVADRGLTALDPAPAESRNGVAVTAETADKLALERLSQLEPLAGDMVFGGPPECPDRDLCLPGLKDIYGLTFGEFLPLDAGGPLTTEALDRGTVDAAIVFTTAGELAGRDLVLLRDDRHLQPSESVTPLVRADVLERFGDTVRATLDRVSSQLTTQDLRALNASVAAGTDPAVAAGRWLDEHRSGGVQG